MVPKFTFPPSSRVKLICRPYLPIYRSYLENHWFSFFLNFPYIGFSQTMVGPIWESPGGGVAYQKYRLWVRLRVTKFESLEVRGWHLPCTQSPLVISITVQVWKSHYVTTLIDLKKSKTELLGEMIKLTVLAPSSQTSKQMTKGRKKN